MSNKNYPGGLIMGLDTGEKAPNFELPAAVRGELVEIELAEELEKMEEKGIVLAFFPLAFSPVCTEELCEFRDSLTEFEELDAKVLGISVDSHYSLRAFEDEEGLTFPLLSDFNKEIIRKYDVVHEDLDGLKEVAKRSIFVLDGDGIIRYKWISDDPSVLPDQSEIKDALGKLD